MSGQPVPTYTDTHPPRKYAIISQQNLKKTDNGSHKNCTKNFSY